MRCYWGVCHTLQAALEWPQRAHLALTVAAGTVQGTAAVHDAGWAHMDLKPDNLCMEIQDGLPHPYLVDFGSSLMQDTSRSTLSCLAVHAQKLLADMHL